MFTKVHIAAMAVLVVGSIISAVILFYTKRVSVWVAAIAVLTVLASIYVGVRRDSYLPFLGETVLPCSLLKESVPDHADTEVTVSGLEPDAKVLFWAAEPATTGLARINNWQRAYLGYANAGVTRVGADGHVTLRIRKPQSYSVPLKGRLEAHVHWRICKEGGHLGPVQTTPISL